MYKALVIGCGNIGAMYDFENESIMTYSKAFYLDPEIEFEIFDVDLEASRKVSERYAVRSLDELNAANFRDYDIVVISTSTATHYEYLAAMLKQGPRLVICEKPVDIDLLRLARLKELYRKADTRVMVNLFRRFQPGYIQLKQEINSLIIGEQCTNIVVNYQRGFHNNGIHALDLLEFLFESQLNLSQAIVGHRSLDEFDADPTLSFSCEWNGTNVQFVGLSNVRFSHFEIAIYFESKAVLLKEGGDQIEMYGSSAKRGNFYPKLYLGERREGVVGNYMENVISQAKLLLKQEFGLADNFMQSVGLSERILTLQERHIL